MRTHALAAVIGEPISHSLSPRLFQYWFDHLEVEGYYIPIRVSPENLRDGLDALQRLGFKGTNVTLPHKTAVLNIATEITPRARVIGAANTLTFQDDKTIHADNTDGVGFLSNLRTSAPEWRPATPSMVLGAGGAARAIIWALLDSGCPQLYLANRTVARAVELAGVFGDRVTPISWDEIADILPTVGTLVNTTSLGMEGQPELSLPYERLQSSTLVTDIVYTPLMTPLLKEAAARGCRVVDGLGMLLHQAVPGFERWFGITPDVTRDVRDHILAALR